MNDLDQCVEEIDKLCHHWLRLAEQSGDITGLEVKTKFEDKNTYDRDIVYVFGNNRNEIMTEIKKLLTKSGIVMYGKKHTWRIY
jgi:hypothetical protein